MNLKNLKKKKKKKKKTVLDMAQANFTNIL